MSGQVSKELVKYVGVDASQQIINEIANKILNWLRGIKYKQRITRE